MADRTCVLVLMTNSSNSLVGGSYSYVYLRSDTYGRYGTCCATFMVNVTTANTQYKLRLTGQSAALGWGAGTCDFTLGDESYWYIEKVGE